MFICEIWLFDWHFLQFCKSDMSNSDISKCFRGSLRLRGNESRLYIISSKTITLKNVRKDLAYISTIDGDRIKILPVVNIRLQQSC